jgi:hypothetical protein
VLPAVAGVLPAGAVAVGSVEHCTITLNFCVILSPVSDGVGVGVAVGIGVVVGVGVRVDWMVAVGFGVGVLPTGRVPGAVVEVTVGVAVHVDAGVPVVSAATSPLVLAYEFPIARNEPAETSSSVSTRMPDTTRRGVR